MKKILFSLLGLFLILGSTYALVAGLFPDTPTLPRVPTGDGTIGKILTKIIGNNDLANYNGDGTVPDSRSLSGVSASGYLKNDVNCSGSEKYVGIDADGKRICGLASMLLTDYGTIQAQDCPADYYRIDNTQGTTGTGDTLKAGDIIKTPPGCTMTIAFADLSLLRLDGDSTISLDLGSLPDGSTIASAILANGSLWGRILTETGSYQIGTDKIVVGVRGTSIALSATGYSTSVTNSGGTWWISRFPLWWNKTVIDLVDSRIATGSTVSCINKYDGSTMTLSPIKPGQSYSVETLGCDFFPPNPISTPKFITYQSNPWVRNNTRKDIDYIYKVQSFSGNTLPPPKMTLLTQELALIAPPTNAVGGTLTLTGLNESMHICEPGDRWWDLRHGCEEIEKLAIADYTRPVPMTGAIAPLVFYGNPPSPLSTGFSGASTPEPGKGISITGSSYITYDTLELITRLSGSMSGKSIIIETDGPVWTGKTLAYFGNSGINKAYIDSFSGLPVCKLASNASLCQLKNLSGDNRNKWEIIFKTHTIDMLRIGGEGDITTTINTRIKKIYIE